MWLVVGAWKGFVVGAHFSARNLALVAELADVTKHFLSATSDPMSVKYCRDRFMPFTMLVACFMRHA